MKTLLALASLLMLAACGSGGPPPPDWKVDSADLVARYQKHALLGENTLAERYFRQAVAATGGQVVSARPRVCGWCTAPPAAPC